MSAADLHLHLNRGAKNNEEWEEWLDLRTILLLEMNLLKHPDISFNIFISHGSKVHQDQGVVVDDDTGGS